MQRVTTRAERNARNRDALLDAARAVFLRSGYHGTTVEAIAREAGFTTGAIYSRFAGKADLFLALLEERIEERARQFAGIPNDGDVPLHAAQRWAAIMRSELDWSLLVIEFRVHAARDPDLAARYAQLHDRSLAGLVENIAASLPPETAAPPERIEQLARAAMAASTGAALARSAEGDQFDDSLYEEIVVGLTRQFIDLPPA
jgi:AcrR family transcriptional regulator